MPNLTQDQIRERVSRPHAQADIRRVKYGFYYCGARVQWSGSDEFDPFDVERYSAGNLGWTELYMYRIHPDDEHLVPPLEEIVFPWEEVAPASPAPASLTYMSVDQTEVGHVYRLHNAGGNNGFIVARIYHSDPSTCHLVRLDGERAFSATWELTPSVVAGTCGVSYWTGVRFERLNFQFDGVVQPDAAPEQGN